MVRSVFAVILLFWMTWQQSEAAAVGLWSYEEGEVGVCGNEQAELTPAAPLRGPRDWHESFPDCDGVMQSPININTSSALYDSSLEPFDTSDYYITNGVSMRLSNVGGHTAEVLVSGTPLYLDGGSLPTSYKLEQLHFHWGNSSGKGSEHSVDSKFFPAELHIVHSQNRFSSVGQAASSPHGLTVLAFLIKAGKENPYFNTIIEYLQHVHNPNDEVEIPTFRVADLIPVKFDYYRYQGSLTTPPCFESAIWSVSLTPVELSESQLTRFRSLYKDEHRRLVDDFRPLQPLNHRTVLVSKRLRSSSNLG